MTNTSEMSDKNPPPELDADWIARQWKASVMLQGEAGLIECLRAFAYRTLQVHGDRNGMREAFAVAGDREVACVPAAPLCPPTERIRIPVFADTLLKDVKSGGSMGFGAWTIQRTADGGIAVAGPAIETLNVKAADTGVKKVLFDFGSDLIAGVIPVVLAETHKLRWEDVDTVPDDTLVILAGTMDHADDWRIKVGSRNGGKFTTYGGSWVPKKWMHLPPSPGAEQPVEVSSEFKCEDKDLRLLLNLSADLLRGIGGADMGLWWANTLRRVEGRLNNSSGADAAGHILTEEWMDTLREHVSNFRKATFEFCQSGHPEDHALMLENQRSIFAHARLYVKSNR